MRFAMGELLSSQSYRSSQAKLHDEPFPEIGGAVTQAPTLRQLEQAGVFVLATLICTHFSFGFGYIR
jgi:hypothetical protein